MSRADINGQAAKWNLGDLAREAIRQGLVPKQAQAAFQTFADAIDDTSDKLFPNLRPGKTSTSVQQQAASAQAATPPPTAPSAATSASGTKAGGWQNLMSGLQSAPKSKMLGRAYGTIANWLNNAAQNGQI